LSTDDRAEPQSCRGKLIGNAAVTGGWRLLRLEQPELAAQIAPGHQVALLAPTGHVQGYVSHNGGSWFALLIPPADAIAADLPPHAAVDLAGPIGRAWPAPASDKPAVVVASGPAIPAALYLAVRLPVPPRLVLLGSDDLPLPFRPVPSRFLLEGLPPPVIGAAPVLESAGIPSRIADASGQPGCYEGSATELLALWLASHPATELEVFACLPDAALAELRRRPSLRVHAAA
jgi:dihydroorotate dehydrogenase electron transfer subunit